MLIALLVHMDILLYNILIKHIGRRKLKFLQWISYVVYAKNKAGSTGNYQVILRIHSQIMVTRTPWSDIDMDISSWYKNCHIEQRILILVNVRVDKLVLTLVLGFLCHSTPVGVRRSTWRRKHRNNVLLLLLLRVNIILLILGVNIVK